MELKSPDSFHQKISLYFHLVIAAPLAGFVYLFLELKHKELQPVISTAINTYIVIGVGSLVAVILTVQAAINFKKRLPDSREHKALKDKLSSYFKESVRLYLLTGLSGILLISGLYLTTSTVFIVLYVFLLFYLSLNRPTPQKYVNDLQLKGVQKDIILHKGEFDQDISI